MLFIIVMTQQFIKKGKILRKSDHVLVLYSNQEKKKKFSLANKKGSPKLLSSF